MTSMTSTVTVDPGFDYLNDPDALFICNICNEAFIDPVLTPCSHTFCRACVTRWMTQKPMSGCPKCRKRLTLSDETLRTDLRLREQLDDLMVECINPRCKWEGRRGDHATHKANGCPVRRDGTTRTINSWLPPSIKRTSATDTMTIFIKTLDGRSMTFEVKPTETVDNLKKSVEERQNIAPDMQRLLFGGKQLEDGKTLQDYNIGPDATGHLTFRMRGG